MGFQRSKILYWPSFCDDKDKDNNVSELTFAAGGLSRMDFFFPSSNRTLSKTIMAGEFKDCSEEKRDIRTHTAQSRWPAVGGILAAALISLVGYLVINHFG